MIESISVQEIRAAQNRVASSIIRTPLVRFHNKDTLAQIYLKLENLQPIGSFKLRGAGNAIRVAEKEVKAQGVYTASMGNMARGVAWNAGRLAFHVLLLFLIMPQRPKSTRSDDLAGIS